MEFGRIIPFRKRSAPVKMAVRLTVSVLEESIVAMDEASQITGRSKTEVVNLSLQLYYKIMEAQRKGGMVYIQEDGSSKPVGHHFY